MTAVNSTDVLKSVRALRWEASKSKSRTVEVSVESFDSIIAALTDGAEPVAWMMTCDAHGRPPEFYASKPSFVPPISKLVPLYTAPRPSAALVDGREVDTNWRLPCAVRLPPATTIGAGCKLSVLMSALEIRASSEWRECFSSDAQAYDFAVLDAPAESALSAVSATPAPAESLEAVIAEIRSEYEMVEGDEINWIDAASAEEKSP